MVQKDDYYPFGLSFNSYQRPSSTEQRYKYNQGAGEKTFRTERIEELGLNVDMTKFRVYDYSLGRFWQVDPAADQAGQETLTPYQYSFNNPVLYNDPFGDCPTCPGFLQTLYYAGKAYFNRLSGATNRLVTGGSGNLPANPNIPNLVRSQHKLMGTMQDSKTIAQAVVDGPGTIASFTSANDIAVLTNGINLDGSSVGVDDYVFAGVGLLLPASGGAVKKLVGKGVDVLSGFVKKFKNQADHLTDLDVTGAIRDILGDPVLKPNGEAFDHLNEVEEALSGVGNQLNKLNRAINSGELSGEVLQEAERLRSSMQKEKDRIQNLLNKARKELEDE